MSDAGEELLAAIYADPSDDAARLVYADWLLSRGDERGELIVLQIGAAERPLTRAEQRRERALIDAHGAAIMGELGRAVPRRHRRISRGFPAYVRLTREGPDTVQYAYGAAEWGTIEHVDLRVDREDFASLVRPELMPALRVVGGVAVEDVGLLSAGWPSLTGLGVRHGRRLTAGTLDGFAALERLHLDYARPEALGALLRSSALRGLREISVCGGTVARWLRHAGPEFPALRVQLNSHHAWWDESYWVVRLTRGRPTALEATFRQTIEGWAVPALDAARMLTVALSQTRASALSSIAVRLPWTWASLKAYERKEFETSVAHFGDIPIEIG